MVEVTETTQPRYITTTWWRGTPRWPYANEPARPPAARGAVPGGPEPLGGGEGAAPAEIHPPHMGAGDAAGAVRKRAGETAGRARRVDEPERAGRRVHAVLHDEREQHDAGRHRHVQRQRRDQRAEQPRRAADEREAFEQLALEPTLLLPGRPPPGR